MSSIVFCVDLVFFCTCLASGRVAVTDEALKLNQRSSNTYYRGLQYLAVQLPARVYTVRPEKEQRSYQQREPRQCAGADESAETIQKPYERARITAERGCACQKQRARGHVRVRARMPLPKTGSMREHGRNGAQPKV
jgi:hypothetical protein